MKLVIATQYRENYGTAQAPYWKFKGGTVYVVENLRSKDVEKININGIPTLKNLIEVSNDSFQEYIIEHYIAEDDADVGEEWESPIMLSYSNNRWTAIRVTKNDEYGYMIQDIERKIETYDIMTGNKHENYTCTFVMKNGDVVKYSDLEGYLNNEKCAELQ